jgi:hypothetical protein
MKCYPIKNPIYLYYSVSNSNIEPFSQYNNLGRTFDSKLNSSSHIKIIKNKFFWNLVFIKRTCGSFLDIITLKILYCSLVRFNPEYWPYN